jgi:AraC-like DNA-binding protein
VRVDDVVRPLVGRLEALPTGVVCASGDGRTVYANLRIERMVGPVPAGVPGPQWASRFGLARPDGTPYRHAREIPLLRALDEGEARLNMLSRDGSGVVMLQAVTAGVSDSAGNTLGSVGIFRPVATDGRRPPLVESAPASLVPRPAVLDAEKAALLLAALQLSERVQQSTAAPLVERALELVRARYAEAWTLDSIAEELCVSPRHLTGAVSAHTGHGLMHVLARARVDQARLLLAETPLTVAAVAHRDGLRDTQRIASTFRRHTGISPATYRSQVTGGSAPRA